MAWNKKKTIRILTVLLVLSLFFATVAIALIIFDLCRKDTSPQWSRSFIYLLATTFGTGLGCIWFRIFKSRRNLTHGLIHTVVIILMFFGHREIFELLDNMDKSFNKYSISILNLFVYLVEYIMSFHLVVIRYGRTPAEKAFRSGLHAFIGALTFFICVVDGLLVCHRMARDERYSHDVTFHLAGICILCYGICTWYIFLNPYFDWRRMNAFSRRQPSKVSIKKSTSRTMSPHPAPSKQSRPTNRLPRRPSRK